MKNIDFKKQVLPHLIAVVLLYVITALFFLPLFKDKTLHQSDIQHSTGVSHLTSEYEKETGQKAYWNPAIFGGTPVYLVGETYDDYPIKSKLINAMSLWLPSPADLIFLAMVFSYICLVAYGFHPIIAFIGAFAFGFCSFNITSVEAGHNAKIRAVAFLPLIIAGVAILFQKRYLLGGGLLAIGLSLQIFTGHIQITYYTLLLAGLIYLVNGIIFIVKKEHKALAMILGVSVIAAGLAGASNLSKLYAGSEYLESSIRGQRVVIDPTKEADGQVLQNGLDKDYAFAWSNGKAEPFTLLVPHFYGGGSSGDYNTKGTDLHKQLSGQYSKDQIKGFFKGTMYWGDQPFTSGPVYIGAIICFLFVFGVLVAPTETKIWLIVGTFFFVGLSMGKNLPFLNDFMFDHFPMYNKFRTVSMTIFVTCFTMTFGAALGLQHILTSIGKKDSDTSQYLYIAGGLTAGLSAVFLVLSGSFSFAKDQENPNFEPIMDAIVAARESLFAADALKSLFFIAAAFLVIYFWRKGKMVNEIALGIIALLVVADTLILDSMYLGKEKFSKSKQQTQAFIASEADDFILADNETYARTYNAQARPDQDSRTSYFHYSVGGYHPAKMRRIQDLYEYYFYGLNEGRAQQVNKILNMLNVRYVKRGETKDAVLVNPEACGNAWFVNTLIAKESPQQVIENLGGIDPSKEAIINSIDYPNLANKKYKGEGDIKLSSYTPNKIVYNAKTNADGFAVFSEIHYPAGWEISIDGKKVEGLTRVNYLLRGLEIPKGNHEVVFEFKPFSYTTGNTITLIATLIVLIGGLCAIVLEFNQNLLFQGKTTEA